MINRLIEWSLRNRFLVACAALFLIAWGVRAVYRTPASPWRFTESGKVT